MSRVGLNQFQKKWVVQLVHVSWFMMFRSFTTPLTCSFFDEFKLRLDLECVQPVGVGGCEVSSFSCRWSPLRSGDHQQEKLEISTENHFEDPEYLQNLSLGDIGFRR
jgi:hypothetical protein